MTEDKFVIKDSGERAQFASGMVRDVTTDKTDYTLIMDGPMFDRWAIHLTKGAKKYAKRNWMKASGQIELDRFRESALRHLIQWFRGDHDEDHAAAVYFNLCGAEYVKMRMADPAFDAEMKKLYGP
jgi:dATP/dGTP diphosphohydrolase